MQQPETQKGSLRRQNRRVLIALVIIFVGLAVIAVARMVWRSGP
jgi:hypothetical protein